MRPNPRRTTAWVTLRRASPPRSRGGDGELRCRWMGLLLPWSVGAPAGSLFSPRSALAATSWRQRWPRVVTAERTLLALLETSWTPLVAGDVISTGTPEGVGFARKPPLWMKPGDVVEVEIDGGIGVLRNPIIAES
jgi:Fumarylacetoacetate (FAA) hydrolase family